MLAIGTKTIWGKVAAVMYTKGERYYFMLDEHEVVSFMPAKVVEASIPAEEAKT